MENSGFGLRERAGAALLTASLALGLTACEFDPQSDGPPHTAATISASAESPAHSSASESASPSISPEYLSPEIRVFPGKMFNKENVDDIQKQIDALGVAYDPKAKVTSKDVVNAAALIAKATIDPVYAHALNYDHRWGASGREMLSAEFLLSDERLQSWRPDHMSYTQLRYIDNLYDALVGGYAPKVKAQSSHATQVLFDKLEASWDKFKQKYQTVLDASS